MKVTKYCPSECDFVSKEHTSICTSSSNAFLLIGGLDGKRFNFSCQPNNMDTYQGVCFSPMELGHQRQASASLSRSCDLASNATTHRLCRLPSLPHFDIIENVTHTMCSSFGLGPRSGFPCRTSWRRFGCYLFSLRHPVDQPISDWVGLPEHVKHLSTQVCTRLRLPNTHLLCQQFGMLLHDSCERCRAEASWRQKSERRNTQV